MASSQAIEELMQKSTYAFQGTVESVGATSTSGVRVSPNTAVVRVDRTLHAPSTLSDQTGCVLTVELTDPQPIKRGDQAIFLAAQVRVFAESVAVKETGRLNVAADQAALVANAAQKLPDLKVQSRAAAADVVIVGKVSQVRPVRPREPYPLSRRDPEWHEAVIDVQSVEKGRLAEKQVVVVFPMGKHQVWQAAPKFQAGQEGVWILQKKHLQLLRRQGFVALDPADFHAKSEVSRIRRLLKAG